MKNAILFVAVFLMGIATQTFAQRNNKVDYKPGTEHRYYNTQEIRFVENGVLYSVATDGTFNYSVLNRPYQYSNSRRNYNTVYYNTAPGHVTYINRRHYTSPQVKIDRYGRIRSIGETLITYQRNGKVRSIGCVALQYHRGLLTRVGNLQIVYNRRGKIKSTIGHVNRYNQQYWHEDWYGYDSGYRDDYDRKRNKKNIK